MREGPQHIDHMPIGPQLLRAAEARAEIIRGEYSPKMQPFIDHFGINIVGNDLKWAAAREAEFNKEVDSKQGIEKRLANVFELLFIEAADKERWLGRDTELKRATRYDDYFNGVDIMATMFQDDVASHLEMSADLTYGTDASNGKLNKIIRDIEQRRLARVKYFHSEHMGFTGSLTGVPRTVIGLDRTNAPEFIRLRTIGEQLEPRVRNTILRQLHEQTLFFRDYADLKHGESPERRKYAAAHSNIERIHRELNIDPHDVLEDQILDNILELRHN